MELDRLKKENERLRKALEDIIDLPVYSTMPSHSFYLKSVDIAKRALAESADVKEEEEK